MGRTRTSAILVAFLFSACSSNEHGAVDEPPPGGSSTQDAGVTDAGVTDAGATDAGTDLADRPFTPSVTSVPPMKCSSVDECSLRETPYSLIYQSEPHIEFREALTNGVLAYDTRTKEYVTYELNLGSSQGDKYTVDERRRLGSSYDRVHAEHNRWLFGCKGASCDLLQPTETKEPPIHIPDELRATTLKGDCVGGTGIACYDENSKTWNWPLRPDAVERPIVAFAYLGGAAFVASDGRKVFVTDQGHTHDLAVGTSDPVLSIAAGWHFLPQHWVGRTASGRLVLGSYGEATTCDASLESTKINDQAGLMILQEKQILRIVTTMCSRTSVPASMTGVGSMRCGLGNEPFVFDAHRIYATPVHCFSD